MRVWLGLALCAAVLGALPAAAMAGSISGTVTAENGGAPIPGVEVCPRREPYTVETPCTLTDLSGHYSLTNLPEGSYKINFSTQAANLKYVSEFYADKEYPWEADLVSVGASQSLTGLDVQLAEGGSISGTATEEGSGNPAVGVAVCAINSQGIPERCVPTGASGQYQLEGLRSGKFAVEFEGGNRANYLREFYKDAETWAAAEDVEVTAPNATSGIDAVLAPGAQILGRVTELGGMGAPMEDVMVCAEAVVGEFEDCDWTDAAGEYALRSLPAGAYLVGFGIEFLPYGRHVRQWWQGASAEAAAAPIEIAPPETRTGIDAQLVNPNRPEPITVTVTPSHLPPLVQHCRRGFVRRHVKGRVVCVKRHRRHRRHRHHHRLR